MRSRASTAHRPFPPFSVYLKAKDYVELDVGTGARCAAPWGDRGTCCPAPTLIRPPLPTSRPLARRRRRGHHLQQLERRGGVEPLDRDGGLLPLLLLRGECAVQQRGQAGPRRVLAQPGRVDGQGPVTALLSLPLCASAPAVFLHSAAAPVLARHSHARATRQRPSPQSFSPRRTTAPASAWRRRLRPS